VPKYFIETFGCQMNFHDSERLAGLLEAEGYEPVPDERSADVVVINTCSVRERAVAKLYSRLGEVRVAVAERNSRPIVAVAGCVAQQEGDRLFARDSSVDVVVGTQRLKELPALVGAARERRGPAIDVRPHDDVSFPLGLARHSDPVRAWVTIIEGCNEFCAFCVVPHTRGHERMRPVRDILAEVQAAVDAGRREIQLLGQIVNHYEVARPVREPASPACHRAARGCHPVPASGLQAPAPAGAVGVRPHAGRHAAEAHAGRLPRSGRSPARRRSGHRALDRPHRRFPGRDGR
jgi:tRNA-2-methylthio-N6-dimethylallyladenosine synthase